MITLEYLEGIKLQIKERKISVVSEKTGISRQTLYNWMKNKSDLQAKNLVKVDEYLHQGVSNNV